MYTHHGYSYPHKNILIRSLSTFSALTQNTLFGRESFSSRLKGLEVAMEFVLQILLLILLSWQHAIGHDCKDYLYFMRNFQLQGNVIETKQNTKYGCRQSCHSHKDCFSINYKEKEYRCELNAATHLSHPQMLRPEANAFHALIKTPNRCSNKHCSSQKRCALVGNKVAYQCSEDCPEKALGMESGAIGDSAITASSINPDLGYVPRYARLNAPSSANNGWIAGPRAAGEYLQVDLGRVVAVTKVATQGRRNSPMWMKTYNIGYSTDLSTWHVYREGGNAQSPHKVFTGNSDQHTVVYGSFEEPIHARGIRFIAQSWEWHISFRVEIYDRCDI